MTILKIVQSLIFGVPFSYFLCGIKIQGNFVTKRLKSVLRELLQLILFPLNIFNPFGIIPLKSIPDIILRNTFGRGSSLLAIFGIFLNIQII